MDKKQLGLYLQIGAIVAGVITALILVKTQLLIVVLLGVEAAVYFVGEYFKKS